jgi:cellulose synthase/poly-beta-1,6-N-acetylglucosamine synthase-like glycosyltransferase
MGFIFLTTLLAVAYLLLQLFYLYHWLKTPEVSVPDYFIPNIGFSVVVVAHNEEYAIEECIRGILQQHYPNNLFEVIIINDRSTDGTVEKINGIQASNIRLLHLEDFVEILHPPAFKKSAIELALQKANYDWIVVTDADCIVPSQWLRSIAYAQSKNDSLFFAVPIRYASKKSMLQKMQEMEMSVLMLVTAAGIRSGLHDMANGANMAFSKQAFLEVGGYKGNYQYASGDDMFLIEKMRKFFPEKISFIKSKTAIVETSSKEDWNSLLKQRIRWAGKNKGLKSPIIHTIWLFVGFYHLWICVTIVLAIFQLSSWWPFIVSLLIKWFADGIIIYSASTFFKQNFITRYFIPLQILYMIYVFRLGWNILLGKKGDW